MRTRKWKNSARLVGIRRVWGFVFCRACLDPPPESRFFSWWSIHFVGGSKGGAGKSLITFALMDYLVCQKETLNTINELAYWDLRVYLEYGVDSGDHLRVAVAYNFVLRQTIVLKQTASEAVC
jgi:hypothetical protein